MDNQTLRKQMRELRRALTKQEIVERSYRLMSHVQDYLLRDHRYAGFLCYYPYDGEVDLRPLYAELLEQDQRLYFQVTTSEEIQFYQVSNLSQFLPGKFGIMEPTSMEVLEDTTGFLAFTPGVAFSVDGERVGYGGGYYDRFFAQHRGVTRLGVCYEMQLSSEITVMDWDVPMDYVATEQQVYTNNHNWSF